MSKALLVDVGGTNIRYAIANNLDEDISDINKSSFNEKNFDQLNSKILLPSHKYLKFYSSNKIILKQKKATEIVFSKKNIPFRSFEINKRDEKTLGELFCYFILETIRLGRAMNVNPFDQPSVELIKQETKKQFSLR